MLRLLSFLFCILAVFVSTARADPRAEAAWSECRSVDDSVRYSGCSKIISSSGYGDKKRLADAFDGRCWALHATGRYSEAVKDCEKSIGINPKSGYVFHNLGTAYLGLKDLRQAIAAFNQALLLNPKMTRSLVKRGHAYAALGRAEDARKDFQAALKLSSGNREAADALAALSSTLPSGAAQAPSNTLQAAGKSAGEMKWDYVSITTQNRAEVNRRALLIANDEYRYIGKLAGPRNDVEATSSLLKQLGFDVSVLLNPSKAEVSQAIRSSVSADAAGGGIFMLYYSGHAAAINGENTVLLPAFDPKRGVDSENSIPLKNLMGELAETRFEKILIAFDACRNAVKVPIEQIASTPQGSTEIRAVRGLQLSAAETQSLRRKEYSILFSTSDGEFALDTGADGLSPFTRAFNTAMKSESSFIPAMVLTKRITEDATQKGQSPTIEIKWNSDLMHGKSEKYSSSAQYEVDFTQTPADHLIRTRLSGFTRNLDQKWRIAKVLAIKGNDFPGCARSVSFVWQSSYSNLTSCYLRRLGFDELQFAQSGSDSELHLYESAEWKTDLDYDGKAEIFYVSHSRYGQSLKIRSLAREIEFVGTVGVNIETIGTLDFNSDGILDVFFLIRPSDGAGEQIVILDGRKIVSSLHEIANCDNVSARRPACDIQNTLAGTMAGSIFETKQFSALGMSSILQIALFVDWNIKYWEFKEDGSLEYTTYGPSWKFERANNESEAQLKKRVRYQNAAAKLEVSYDDGARVLISPVFDYLKSHQAARLFPR